MTATVVESDERPPARYRRLMVEFLLAREKAGGRLPAVEEARRSDELDRVWWSMTDAEQDDYERAVGRTIAKVWRRRVVPLGPQPSLAPPVALDEREYHLTVGYWWRRRKQRRIARTIARKAARAEPPPDWLDEQLSVPRWLLLVAWLVHLVTWLWLGRLSVGWLP